MNRRRFLQLSAAVAPTLWLRRAARGATPRFGAVDHVLVLFAKGGLRSHALWNAVGGRRYNPWGVQAAQAGTRWTLGAACGAADLATRSFGVLPGFAKSSREVAVLPCVDHAPGGVPEVDHDAASYLMAGGSAGGEPGLLTRIGRDHPRYAAGFSLAAMPPVEIYPSEFGAGAGVWARARPIQVRSPYEGFAAGGAGGARWELAAREAMAARFLAARPGAYGSRIAGYNTAKHNTAVFAPVLGDPIVDVLGAPEAAAGGLTNAQLVDVLGNYTTDALGDPEPVGSWGPGVAMALRFFHFGAPIAVVTREHHDLHDAEDRSFPPRAADLVRQLAGLQFLLKRMTHARGGTYWDRTVVAVVSEFSRNNTSDATGFNSGRGSDHVLDDANAMRNQAIAIMGGAIARRGELLGGTTAAMAPTGAVYSTRRLLSTLLDLLGMSHEAYWPDAPIAELVS